jgi:hypothetical protein
VPLLLLAFDPRLALAHLPGVAGRGGEALRQAVAQRLLGHATLAGPPPTGGLEVGEDEDGDGDEAETTVEDLAGSLLAALTPAERAAPRALLDRLDNALAGVDEAGRETLAAGAPLGLFLRAAHRLWHDGGSFFDPGSLGALDRGIVAAHLPEGCGPRVVVAGHTHAAREAQPGDGRVYLNTGTWTDLLRVPEEGSVEALLRWADELRGGKAPRLRRLHYAEITAEAARLKLWPSGSAAGTDEASP